MSLIDELIEQGVLKTPQIIDAFRAVKREDFLPEGLKDKAEVDQALPIGHGATISQPYTVAFMLEMLQPRAGHKILDIGSGSGWQTALLAHIVGEQGSVHAIERVPELKELGERNVKAYQFKNITFYCQDGSKGLPQHASFDRIVAAAAASVIPDALRQQLAVRGRMLIPTAQNDIRLVVKKATNDYAEEVFPGFVFVPLITEE